MTIYHRDFSYPLKLQIQSMLVVAAGVVTHLKTTPAVTGIGSEKVHTYGAVSEIVGLVKVAVITLVPLGVSTLAAPKMEAVALTAVRRACSETDVT
jgi:hypothetical protein